LIDYERVKLEV